MCSHTKFQAAPYMRQQGNCGNILNILVLIDAVLFRHCRCHNINKVPQLHLNCKDVLASGDVPLSRRFKRGSIVVFMKFYKKK
jgi:hypothetical protein